MTTRLVERLEREIAQCEDPFERECLKAQHAAVIARLGQLDHARFVLGGLKTQARRHGKPTLQAWVHFVAGSIEFFSAVLSQDARESFKASAAMAKIGGETQLEALACAWVAAVEIQIGPVSGVFESLSSAMLLAKPNNHAVWSRAWLVLADAADFAGRTDEAMLYYEAARQRAAADGDSTSVSLIMFNRANSLVSRHVRRELFGVEVRTSLDRALGEIESTKNLDAGLGNTALDSSVPILQAEALMLSGRWTESIALTNQNFGRQVAIGAISFSARQLVCRSWCYANLPDKESAWRDAQAAIDSLRHVTSADDKAVVHGLLARVFSSLDHLDLARKHAADSAHAFKEHVKSEKQLSRLFDLFKKSAQKAVHPWPQD